MDPLEGIWRLVDSRAEDEGTGRVSAPYGAHPMGQIMFQNGRMLAALCNGDAGVQGGRGFSSYGGPYSFDGTTLITTVDMASDTSRIGGQQVRTVVMVGTQMLLRPPARLYGDGVRQRRELVWERVWLPHTPLPEPVFEKSPRGKTSP